MKMQKKKRVLHMHPRLAVGLRLHLESQNEIKKSCTSAAHSLRTQTVLRSISPVRTQGMITYSLT